MGNPRSVSAYRFLHGVRGRRKECKVERSKIILKRMFQIALVVSAIGLSSGCQSKLTKEARAGINCVSINTEVPIPSVMLYEYDTPATASTWWNLPIIVGGEALFGPSRVKRGRAIMAIMWENDIDPGKILVTQFKEQLEAKQVFPCIVRADGDASFTFKIIEYGLLASGSGYSWSPYPLKTALKVKVYLKKPDGTLVWSNDAETGFMKYWREAVDEYRHDEYIEDPNLLRKGFEQAASKIVGQFFKNIEAN